jgi:pilus assembly protein Flp/PilA
MIPKIKRLVRDQAAATAIEYSLIAGGVALAIIITVQGLGSNVNSLFGSVSAGFK